MTIILFHIEMEGTAKDSVDEIMSKKLTLDSRGNIEHINVRDILLEKSAGKLMMFNHAVKMGDFSRVKSIFKELVYDDQHYFIFQINYRIEHESIRVYLRNFIKFSTDYGCGDYEDEINDFVSHGYLNEENVSLV